MIEFLSSQEEMANDVWMSRGRELLANAIRAANEKIAKEDEKKGEPQRNEGNNTYAKIVANTPTPQQGGSENNNAKRNVNNMNRDKTQPGCSHWESSSGTTKRKPEKTPTQQSDCSDWDDEMENKKTEKTVATPKPPVNVQSEQKVKQPVKNLNKATSCLGCGGPHPLYHCAKFLSMPLPKRKEYALELKTSRNVCMLCLNGYHHIMACPDRPCGQCKEPHNSTLCPISVARKRLPKKKDEKNNGNAKKEENNERKGG